MPNDAKAEDKSKKPKKGRLVLLIGAMLALLGVVAAIFLSLQQNLLTVMSFNIHHDEGESMWSVEVEFTSDSDYGFYIYTTGLPPSNWDQTEYGHIAEGPGGELRFFFLGYRAYNVL